MDISYLLWLQEFRYHIHEALTPYMESISLFAISYLILVPAFIYWTVNKRKGLFILAALNFTMALNVLVKLTFCVYRPWIRDPHILPAGDSIKTATGYSFPSGHTAIATAVYGGLVVSYWRNKKIRWLLCLCVLAILLTGFSRNYLGVHTPQDVIVGLVLGIFSLWLTRKAFVYMDKHPEQENKLLLGGIIFVILSLVYITYKPYPIDYVEGKLLVDPRRMMNNGYSNMGGLLGFCIARFVERRWIKFSPATMTVKRVIFSLVGLLPLLWMIKSLSGVMVGWLGPHAGRLLAQGIWVFYIVAFYPFIVKCFCSSQSMKIHE